jgi:hypothetical protein
MIKTFFIALSFCKYFCFRSSTHLSAADQRNLNTKASIADMAAELENDRRENVRKFAQALEVSARTVYAALMRTVKLSKKSAKCVNKWLSLEMKKERFRAY